MISDFYNGKNQNHDKTKEKQTPTQGGKKRVKRFRGMSKLTSSVAGRAGMGWGPEQAVSGGSDLPTGWGLRRGGQAPRKREGRSPHPRVSSKKQGLGQAPGLLRRACERQCKQSRASSRKQLTGHRFAGAGRLGTHPAPSVLQKPRRPSRLQPRSQWPAGARPPALHSGPGQGCSQKLLLPAAQGQPSPSRNQGG